MKFQGVEEIGEIRTCAPTSLKCCMVWGSNGLPATVPSVSAYPPKVCSRHSAAHLVDATRHLTSNNRRPGSAIGHASLGLLELILLECPPSSSKKESERERERERQRYMRASMHACIHILYVYNYNM